MKLFNAIAIFWMLAVISVMFFLSGCVTKRHYVHDVLYAYQKGLRVGRVIGRDQVLGDLKSQSCFKQTPDALMNPTAFDKLADESARQTDQELRARELQLGIVK